MGGSSEPLEPPLVMGLVMFITLNEIDIKIVVSYLGINIHMIYNVMVHGSKIPSVSIVSYIHVQ